VSFQRFSVKKMIRITPVPVTQELQVEVVGGAGGGGREGARGEGDG
jgi:hypothetical protein